ncbi:MAG: DUF4893 domain-containing protein [Sphingomonas sp.]|nr:DUF4893 domain-containing protein [Sphingomonas sp.]MBW0006170.1 DUF4893 domain-containing protein [Sphingomonas sp.]
MRAFLIASALACSGCDVIEQPNGLLPTWTTNYKQAISENDRVRLRDWRKTFESALADARKSNAADIAREGSLLDPDSALAGPAIPDGMYSCRVIKLGARDSGNLNYVSYPAFTCRVHAQRTLQRLTKLSGSQRYVGLIFPGDAIHSVFLGTLVLGDEMRALQYGQDQERDVAGYIERIGPNRWRLLMPQPHFESRLDVMELVPQGATH